MKTARTTRRGRADKTMRLAVQQLLEDAPDTAKVEAWMAGKKFPLVEGTSATFVWRGEADGVKLRHFIYALESAQPLTRVPNTDLWYLSIEVPPRSRIEYKLEVSRNGHNEWLQDPLNPHRARDPFGANSVLQGEGYESPEWTREDPVARRGTLEPLTYDSKHLGRRTGLLYLPARFRRTKRYPLIVVHDGSDYLNYSGMRVVLDNLVHRLEIPEVVAAFVDSPDRLREYANDERHAKFIAEELVPHLESQLPLRGKPQGRCLMGASFGAVASLSTAWRYPGFFGRLLLQSGSFAFTEIGRRNHRGPLFDRVVEFVNAFRDKPTAVSERVFLSCGTYESLIYENRSIVPLLDSTGMQVKLVEARDGHNWENWRDRLREGLSWLFPGPLMMIYE
jgi:enterochelin esterase-like enzyme